MRFQTARRLMALPLLLLPAVAQAQTPATPATAPASTPAAKVAGFTLSGVTSRAASATAITVNKAIKGQFVSCPAALKVSKQAVCLYTKDTTANVRSLVKSALGSEALGDWKTAGQASSLLVRDAAGNLAAFVLLSPVTNSESLVIVDGISAPAAAKPAAPAGVVKGQPYLLGSDLTGVVNVVNLGGGKYRLNVAGQTAVTITAGSKTAQRAGGNVELPLAPVTDGKNLIYPVAGLRALGCTVTDAGKGVTIACGSDSVGVKPIVF